MQRCIGRWGLRRRKGEGEEAGCLCHIDFTSKGWSAWSWAAPPEAATQRTSLEEGKKFENIKGLYIKNNNFEACAGFTKVEIDHLLCCISYLWINLPFFLPSFLHLFFCPSIISKCSRLQHFQKESLWWTQGGAIIHCSSILLMYLKSLAGFWWNNDGINTRHHSVPSFFRIRLTEIRDSFNHKLT